MVGDDGFVAEDHAVLDDGAAADVAVAPDDRSAHDRFLADPAVRPHDGVLEDRVFFDVALAAEDAVRPYPCAGLDDNAVVDEARALEHRAVFDPRLGRDERRRRTGRKPRPLSAPVPEFLRVPAV